MTDIEVDALWAYLQTVPARARRTLSANQSRLRVNRSVLSNTTWRLRST